MKEHIKIYIEYYEIAEQDKPLCELECGRYINDIHHIIFKSQGGKDVIHNLIGLCREHHDESHNSRIFNQKLKDIKYNEFNREANT